MQTLAAGSVWFSHFYSTLIFYSQYNKLWFLLPLKNLRTYCYIYGVQELEMA
jgi:hypothetical protein